MTTTRITWLDHVAKMFTQYDVIQMRFRLDLADYDSVKAHAKAIAMAISSGHPNTATRMPNNEPAWPDGQIAAFQSWIDEGFWYSQAQQSPPSPAPPDRSLQAFIQLSSALTGFDLSQPMDQLHPADDVAGYFLDRIRGWSSGTELDALVAAYQQSPASLADLASAAQYGALCKQITLLWYTGALVTITGSGASQTVSYDFGTPGHERYASGLAWQAAQAHPMGYSIEQFGYWANEPQGTAWTGLGQSSGV